MSKRIIRLGKWEGKPIEWMVLKKESLGTMVISKNALFTCSFNRNPNDNKWKNSTLRTYLNEEFFHAAFSESEKKRIINVYLSKPYQTKDNVFVLSVEEADSLMTDKERANGNLQWTRTPNENRSSHAWRIGPDGGFDDFGRYSGYSYVANSYDIRPAMWIREK